MAEQQPNHMNPSSHREERFFPIALRGNENVIRQAMEHALGVQLDALSTGLWAARKDLESDLWLDIMVRALPVQGGTSIEVDIKPRWTTLWGWLYGVTFVVGCIAIVPLIWAIWYGVRRGERLRRHQLVHMHRTWTELAEAVGAPVRGDGYRGQPKRIYAPSDSQETSRPARVEVEAPTWELGEDVHGQEERLASEGTKTR